MRHAEPAVRKMLGPPRMSANPAIRASSSPILQARGNAKPTIAVWHLALVASFAKSKALGLVLINVLPAIQAMSCFRMADAKLTHAALDLASAARNVGPQMSSRLRISAPSATKATTLARTPSVTAGTVKQEKGRSVRLALSRIYAQPISSAPCATRVSFEMTKS